MGEGTKYATTAGDVRKFIEQINYQEIDEGEVSDLNFSIKILIGNINF